MANININNLDFQTSNIIFVNGLTLESVKIKYNWLLNAKVQDAIIGEDSNGIVWYFGDWICGEWFNGTWYSGTFHDGVWKSGSFYSYRLNKFDVLSNKFNIIEETNTHSLFKNGKWLNGNFYSGTFGINNSEIWTDYTLYNDDDYPNYKAELNSVGGNFIIDKKNLATWVYGYFHNGLIYDSIWINGKFFNGIITNSKWLTGEFYNGYFIGDEWLNGLWFNGEFLKGIWRNGTFTKLKSNLNSRFGSSTTGYTCYWYDGTWKNGDFFSNLVLDNYNNPIESTNNGYSYWYGGTWINGNWYGGHFVSGTWKNGIWKNGIFGPNLKQTDWTESTYVYELYNVNGNMWSGNTSMIEVSSTSNNDLGYSLTSANTSYQWQYYMSGSTIVPVSLPSDCGSGYSYWNYTETRLSGSTGVLLLSSTEPLLNNEIYVVQNDGYSNETYQGYTTILDSGITSDLLYYIKINKSWAINGNDSGKVINYSLYNERLAVQSPIIMFHTFDLNFDYIDNDNTVIRGILVKATINVEDDNCTLGEFDNLKISLPLYDLFLSDFDDYSGDPIYTSVDQSYYDDLLYSESGYTNVKGYKIKNIDLTNNTYLFGDIDDCWNLSGLTEFYPSSATSYNIYNIDTFRDRIRVAVQMNLNGIVSQSIKISDIQLKAIYNDINDLPIWENGNWYKGTFINGTVYNGNFSSMLWLNGTFSDGYLGKDFNTNRN